MLGVIEMSKQQANSLTESAKEYEGNLGTLKDSTFYKAMKELRENIIQ